VSPPSSHMSDNERLVLIPLTAGFCVALTFQR